MHDAEDVDDPDLTVTPQTNGFGTNVGDDLAAGVPSADSATGINHDTDSDSVRHHGQEVTDPGEPGGVVKRDPNDQAESSQDLSEPEPADARSEVDSQSQLDVGKADGIADTWNVELDAPASGHAASNDIDPGAEAAEPAPELMAESAVEEVLRRIERRLDEVVRLGERNADHVGSLHAENQRLRTGEIATAVAPLIRDVIRVHDDILRLEDSSPREAATDLRLVRDLVVGVLDRWGVRPFEPMHGDSFDTTEHNGLARVETSEALDGTVAAVRRCGFRADDGRVWRPADVEVFRQIKPEAEEPACQGE